MKIEYIADRDAFPFGIITSIDVENNDILIDWYSDNKFNEFGEDSDFKFSDLKKDYFKVIK